MEYSSVITQVQIQVQRRAEGRAVLRVTSDRAITDPFVDLVVEANWSTGRITRSYTMLFDPPALRRAPAAPTAQAQIPAPEQARPAPAPRAPAPAPAITRPAPVAAAPTENVTVKPGDTAGRIASAHRPADVSLDQMLVALLRANPDAFIQGNVNRLKAGAVLQLPGSAEAGATPNGEARKILAAQSRDFNEFRRKLAGSAPTAEVAASGRAATGKVQTQVDDQRASSTAPDKLTLSKGAIQGKKSTEEQLAQRKQANEAAARAEELSKNISELSKLSAASAAPGAASPATSAASEPAVPGIAVPGVASPETPASAADAAMPEGTASEAAPAAAAEPAASVASEAAEAASEAAPAKPVVVPAPMPQPAPAEEPGFLSGLMDDPMVPLVGGGLLALLLGYGAWRVVQRRRNGAGMDSSFLESRLQPDSFFGASGGQRVDTAGTDSTTGGSSMAYSPSQLDAGGDVDPVAEADVYLAYGRDLQAEEILKEAVRHNPARVSVHAKLGEIYAKRQDRKALESVATEIHSLTQGEGPDWNRIAELGRNLDPDNTLYQPGGRPTGGLAVSLSAPDSMLPPDMDLDLDLDLDLPDDALTDAPAASAGNFAAAAASAQAAVAPAAPEPDPMDSILSAQPAWTPPTAPAVAPNVAAPSILDMPMVDLPTLDTQPDTLESAPPAYKPSDSGLMEFDLDSISLDLDTPAASASAANSAQDEEATAAASLHDDPLATKLALAQEFNTIGDSDGARTLIEEVIAESTGTLKARAQKMLSELS
jgi:pilus assembly protein FimV